jgi:hypothetical protein
MTSKIYIDKDGNLSGLADDTLDKLHHMGIKNVSRVSNVEFDHSRQCWTATDLNGCVIAEGKVRSEVIEAERRYLNKTIEDAFAAML